MKHIYKYLLAILPFFMLIGCDDNDAPTYSQLELESNEINFKYAINDEIKGQEEINIVKGNGNYILTKIDNSLTSIEALDKIKEIEAEGGNADTIVVATAKVEGNKLVITPKYTGTITYKLQDWAKSTQVLTIIVDQDKPDEEITTRTSIFNIKVEGKASTDIYSGNGDYKVESLDPAIATVSLDGLSITATAIAKGSTKIRITDKKNKEAFIDVNVDDALIPLALVDDPGDEKVWLETGGQVRVFQYEGGNGGMSYTLSSLYGTVAIDEDAETITLTTKTYRSMTTLKVIDRYGQEIAINLAIDYPFLENKTARLLRDDKFSTITTTQRTAEYIPSLNRSFIQSGSTGNYGSGTGITFTGNLSVGVKTSAKIYSITGTGAEKPDTDLILSQCEIVKIDGNVYWITFTQQESGQTGYIVITAP